MGGRRRVLVTGGARSGKSRFAESLLLAEPDVTYVATGGSRAGDAEWAARVRQHQDRRPASWRTVETLDLREALTGPAVLLDCLTLWLSRSMFSDDGEPREPPVQQVVEAVRAATGTLVVVTSEVGSGIVPADAATRAYADALGELNADVAAECDEVWQCVVGIPVRLR